MATVVKNFRVKSGLIVEGTTGTIGGNAILAESAGDSYILNLVGGATLVKSVDTAVFGVDGSGNLTVNANTFDSYGSASAAQAAAITAAATDAASKANAAQAAAITAAATDATTKVGAEAALRVSGDAASVLTAAADATSKANAAQAAAEDYADGLAVNYDPAGSAAAAQAAAEDYADGLAVNYDPAGSAAAAQAAAEEYTDTAVANVVGAAPELLDTLQELAAALENNPDIIADLQDVAAGKQDTLSAGSNIDITGSVISVTGLDTADVAEDASRLYFTDARALTATAIAYDAAGAAEDAENNANTYADGLVNNLVDGTTAFTELNINDFTLQTVNERSAYGTVEYPLFDGNTYRSAKVMVKADNGTHTQISELLLTLDQSNNIAVTEYGIVTTNGMIADYNFDRKGSGAVTIIITTLGDYSVTATVFATAIK